MTRENPSPWIRNWTIIRADLDIAHVMLPLSNFRLENTVGADSTYQVVHSKQAPVPDCFSGAVLAQIGTETPTLFMITGMERLPSYTQDTAAQYIKVSELMATYVTANPQVERLEGVIKIPCHAPGGAIPAGALAGHAPLTVKTLIQFYQFPNAVDGDLSLLVVRAPLSPACPMNGDGTAVGVGHN